MTRPLLLLTASLTCLGVCAYHLSRRAVTAILDLNPGRWGA